MIVYKHPEWSLQNREDYLGLQHLHGIEVSNGSCILYMDCTGIHFQQMLRIELRDAAGNRAYSNAYFTDSL